MVGENMNITADTNILVRVAMQDNAEESALAATLLREARIIAVPVLALCEFVWVIGRGYGMKKHDIAAAIQSLMDIPNVKVNVQAVKAGLEMLKAGGDFADGIIAYEGHQMGGQIFATFDRKAALLLTQSNKPVHCLSTHTF
jgi:predicted nucleic-acid-binding protein